MGYTHYWKQHRPLTEAEFKQFRIFIHSVNDGTILIHEDEEGKVLVFNDVDDDLQHEDFFFNANKVSDFQFCKTAEKRYDKFVVASLIFLDILLGEAFEWSSDGKSKDHIEGAQIVINYASALLPDNEYLINEIMTGNNSILKSPWVGQ